MPKLAECVPGRVAFILNMGGPTSGIDWNSHSMGGNVYAMDHLGPFLWEVTIPAKAPNPERILKIVVSYSMHCFTRKPSADEDVAADAWYSDTHKKSDASWDYSFSHIRDHF